MIDTVRLNIKAGDGGNGCISFLREKFKPYGGPNGGDGGDGGSVYLTGDSSLNTLLHLKYQSTTIAQRGGHGRGKNQRGANGEDTIIRVPIGTVVCRLGPGGERELLTDITDTTPQLVARSGRGGWGNAHYVSSTNQEPMLAQKGEPGEEAILLLELKLLADVGLLAKPNAGKSTLLSRCSAAKPRIADYPFTTVEPVLGVVTTRGKSFVMMEIPGLIEGAHEGVGLGHEFLRHAERTRLYLHILDGLSEDPVADFHMINEELSRFNPALADKPQMIVVNKIDIPEVRERCPDLEKALRQVIKEEPSYRSPGSPLSQRAPIFFVSAATGEGIDAMLGKTAELLEALRVEEPADTDPSSQENGKRAARRPRRVMQRGTVTVEDGVFVVKSAELERLAALADVRDYRVLLQLWREMTQRGIAQQLEEAGIEAGDTIRIGKVEVAWF